MRSRPMPISTSAHGPVLPTIRDTMRRPRVACQCEREEREAKDPEDVLARQISSKRWPPCTAMPNPMPQAGSYHTTTRPCCFAVHKLPRAAPPRATWQRMFFPSRRRRARPTSKNLRAAVAIRSPDKAINGRHVRRPSAPLGAIQLRHGLSAARTGCSSRRCPVCLRDRSHLRPPDLRAHGRCA